jgi:hypothetical protein
MKTITEKISELIGDGETTLLASGFEDALLGIAWQFNTPIAVYDREKCIEILCADMTLEEAEEYFQFNVQGAYVGETTPAFLSKI